MTTSTMPAACPTRRGDAPPEPTGHPLLGLKTATKRILELDRLMADRSLSQVQRREILAQLRAMIRAADGHLSYLLESSFQQRYQPLAD